MIMLLALGNFLTIHCEVGLESTLICFEKTQVLLIWFCFVASLCHVYAGSLELLFFSMFLLNAVKITVTA